MSKKKPPTAAPAPAKPKSPPKAAPQKPASKGDPSEPLKPAGPILMRRVLDDLLTRPPEPPRTRKRLENRIASVLAGSIGEGAEVHFIDLLERHGGLRFDGTRAVYDDAVLRTTPLP